MLVAGLRFDLCRAVSYGIGKGVALEYDRA
jgi:hypothetical protein